LAWHRDRYVADDPERNARGRNPVLYRCLSGQWKLTTAERKRILLNSIYGVDIDPQAVEVTKLSLLLKVLEGESKQSLEKQLLLYHERALPDLAGNIKCGNSLIGPDFYENHQGTLFDEDERYRINIGRSWRISRGTEFTLTTPTFGEGGKVTGFRETGRMEVRRGEDASSLVDLATLKQGEKVQIGDRVVRRSGSEGDEGDRRSYVLLTTKGGVGTDVNALPGTNVYLDGEWKGATGTNGQAEIPLRPGRSYALMLYRHGYQQFAGKFSVEKSGEAREFTLAANNALFRIDSEPSPAAVYIDDEQVGKTPIAAGRPVTLGFHSVRLTYGEDYRDFFEVMEFSKKEEDRKVVLQKDFLKIGERARQQGDVDGAIKSYAAAGRDHPDYAEARRRLGGIYLDDKEDYDRAIAEFETVLALPENEQLIYKQFAVTFTNLGHAYAEKGSRLVNSDRDAASQSFAKAIKALQTAKQNTRFFPKEEYDEAVHDTYYYMALAYHKLYLITKQPAVMNSASLAWREYFDFFPKKLESDPNFAQAREAARRYRDQIQEQ